MSLQKPKHLRLSIMDTYWKIYKYTRLKCLFFRMGIAAHTMSGNRSEMNNKSRIVHLHCQQTLKK